MNIYIQNYNHQQLSLISLQIVHIAFQYTFIAIIAACCLALSIYSGMYFILKYLTKSDVFKQNIVTKIFLMFCVALTTLIPLLLPIDSSLSIISDATKGLTIMWQVIFYTVIFMVVILLPSNLFYIEELLNEKSTCKTLLSVIIQEIICIVVLIVINCVFYFTMGEIQIEIPTYNEPTYTPPQSDIFDLLLHYQDLTQVNVQYEGKIKMELPIGFFSYMLSLFIFLTSIFFTVFFGIGIVSFPLDQLQTFLGRPKILSKTKLIEYKIQTAQKAQKIVQRIDNIYSILLANNFMNDKNAMRIAIKQNDIKKLFGKEKKLKQEFIKLQQTAIKLRKQYDQVMEYNSKETANPLKYMFHFIFGIIASLFSILLMIQIILIEIGYFLPQYNSKLYFLSTMLNAVEKATKIPLFSCILFVLIAFYVTVCYISGITKFGFRFILFISIHEMEIGNTELSSMIFNIILIMGCSLSCIKFLGQLCEEFVRGSGIDIILSNITGNIKYLQYWFQYSSIALIIISVITLIYMLIAKNKKAKKQIESIEIDGIIEQKDDKKDKKKDKKDKSSKKSEIEMKENKL